MSIWIGNGLSMKKKSSNIYYICNFLIKFYIMSADLLACRCGYDQKSPGPHPPPPTSGILGLGRGKASIVSQLQIMGIMRNVIGHCLSRLGGGFLFFGDHLVPSSRITWMPMSRNSLE